MTRALGVRRWRDTARKATEGRAADFVRSELPGVWARILEEELLEAAREEIRHANRDHRTAPAGVLRYLRERVIRGLQL